MDIVEWTRHFLKHQDLLKREIREIEERTAEGCTLLVARKKDGTEDWYVAGDVAAALRHVDASKRQGIVCLNTRTNLQALIAAWKTLAAHPTLKVVFANPKTNERWMLVPNHHDRVADEESLALGLETLHTSITTV